MFPNSNHNCKKTKPQFCLVQFQFFFWFNEPDFQTLVAGAKCSGELASETTRDTTMVNTHNVSLVVFWILQVQCWLCRTLYVTRMKTKMAIDLLLKLSPICAEILYIWPQILWNCKLFIHKLLKQCLLFISVCFCCKTDFLTRFEWILENLEYFHQFWREFVSTQSCCFFSWWKDTFTWDSRSLNGKNVKSQLKDCWEQKLIVL